MYRWAVDRVVRWAIRRLTSGDPSAAISLFAADARFEFPGSSTWAANLVGKDDIAGWFRRFAALRPDYEVVDVLASGPPWNMRAAVRFRDHIGDDYTNEGMQYLRIRWGRIRVDEVFLDTERVAAWEARDPVNRRRESAVA